MPTTPTPETRPETLDSLEERVQDHREELIVLMADTGRCDDIASGILDILG